MKLKDQKWFNPVVDVLYWILLTIGGGLLPIWGGVIVLLSFSQNISLLSFPSSGELAVFGAGLLTATIYEVTKEISPNISLYLQNDVNKRSLSNILKISFPYSRIFIVSSTLFLLIAAISFSIITASNIRDVDAPLNEPFIRSIASFVFVISFIIGTFVTYFSNNLMSKFDFHVRREESYVDFVEDFDTIKDN